MSESIPARFKLAFFAPRTATRAILAHLHAQFPQTVGLIGGYQETAFVSPGIGQFRPGPGTRPTIGTPGTLEFVEEDRVETVVHERDANTKGDLRAVILELNKVHPYEEVAYDVYRIEDI